MIALAGFARSSDTSFAIYNTGALLSALCHLAGVALGAWRGTRVTRPVAWLAVVYGAGAAMIGLVAYFAFTGRIPSSLSTVGARPGCASWSWARRSRCSF